MNTIVFKCRVLLALQPRCQLQLVYFAPDSELWWPCQIVS